MKQRYFPMSLIAAIAISVLYLSSSTGRDDNRAGAPTDQSTCGLCHSGSGNGVVNLTGVPTSYEPGVSYSLSLTVTESGSSATTQNVAGFQIVASDGITGLMQGTFTAGTGTRVNSTSRLVQSSPLAYDVNNEATWSFDWTAPTGGPEEVIFYFAANSANGTGGTGGDITYFNTSNSVVLPVVWSYLEVDKVANHHILSWGTETEINSDYFAVERSIDGDNFQHVARVDAVGFSYTEQRYEQALTPILGIRNYYRIKQVDLDGQFSYSKIVSVESDAEIAIYPTVFTNDLQITSDTEITAIILFDMQGNLVMQASNPRSLDASLLAPASYNMLVYGEQGQILTQKKLIKVR